MESCNAYCTHVHGSTLSLSRICSLFFFPRVLSQSINAAAKMQLQFLRITKRRSSPTVQPLINRCVFCLCSFAHFLFLPLFYFHPSVTAPSAFSFFSKIKPLRLSAVVFISLLRRSRIVRRVQFLLAALLRAFRRLAERRALIKSAYYSKG